MKEVHGSLLEQFRDLQVRQRYWRAMGGGDVVGSSECIITDGTMGDYRRPALWVS